VKRRPAGQFPFFQQDDIGAPGFGQMIGHAGAEDPPADNDDLGLVFHC